MIEKRAGAGRKELDMGCVFGKIKPSTFEQFKVNSWLQIKDLCFSPLVNSRSHPLIPFLFPSCFWSPFIYFSFIQLIHL